MADITVKDNSPQFMEQFRQRVDKALNKVGIHLEGEAKEELNNSPRRIDTGLLRNSITYAVSGGAPAIKKYSGDNPSRYSTDETIPRGSYSGKAPSDPDNQRAVYIGTNVEYAPYVHEGTSRMAPNRFLKNALTRNEEQIRKIIEDSLLNE